MTRCHVALFWGARARLGRGRRIASGAYGSEASEISGLPSASAGTPLAMS
jgi:hypothetical protein